MNSFLASGGAELLSALGAAAATFLTMWGMQKNAVKELERRQGECEKNLGAIWEKVNGLTDVYVNYRHFNETMNQVRESYRDLKEDLKRVLELLSVRG